MYGYEFNIPQESENLLSLWFGDWHKIMIEKDSKADRTNSQTKDNFQTYEEYLIKYKNK